DFRNPYAEIRYAPVCMSKNGSLRGFLVHTIDCHTCEKVQFVYIVLIFSDDELFARLGDVKHCLEQLSLPVLYVLAERMKIGCKVGGRRKNPFAFFALTFTE